jgi:hypothetical protein
MDGSAGTAVAGKGLQEQRRTADLFSGMAIVMDGRSLYTVRTCSEPREAKL